MNISAIVKQAIDLHLHIGPELIPRKYVNVKQLIKDQKQKIGGFALKNHFYMTTPFIEEVSKNDDLYLIGGVVLNNFVGGINPEAVYAAAIISKKPIIVWFPTTDAQQFLINSEYQIAPEWVQSSRFTARSSRAVVPITILDKSKNLTKKTRATLRMIKKMDSILATGHLSWQESFILCNEALRLGINKIIITHPIYQKIQMPAEIQQRLAKAGCYIEICYSMYSIDKIPIKTIVKQINEVGYNMIVLSSDVGQKFSAAPDKALKHFAEVLMAEGITSQMLYRMMVTNPWHILRR